MIFSGPVYKSETLADDFSLGKRVNMIECHKFLASQHGSALHSLCKLTQQRLMPLYQED